MPQNATQDEIPARMRRDRQFWRPSGRLNEPWGWKGPSRGDREPRKPRSRIRGSFDRSLAVSWTTSKRQFRRSLEASDPATRDPAIAVAIWGRYRAPDRAAGGHGQMGGRGEPHTPPHRALRFERGAGMGGGARGHNPPCGHATRTEGGTGHGDGTRSEGAQLARAASA